MHNTDSGLLFAFGVKLPMHLKNPRGIKLVVMDSSRNERCGCKGSFFPRPKVRWGETKGNFWIPPRRYDLATFREKVCIY